MMLVRMLTFAVLGLLGLAAYWSVRLGYADYLARGGSVESLQEAVRRAPDSARYHVWLAATLDWNGRGAEGEKSMNKAVQLNPRDWASWMDLGLRAELEGDFARAERCLLEAAKVKRGYEPRWTLLNYYYRRGDEENFWKWARSATQMSYGDNSLLLRLYWKVSQDPDLILRSAIPEEKGADARYLWFLLGDNHLEATESTAMRLVNLATSDELPVLLASCDRLLEAHNLESAMRIWGALCARKLLPYQALQPERGLSLTNGDFRQVPLLHGFDWRVHPPEGVTVNRGGSPVTLRVTFSGKQPENCEIVSQWLPVAPATSYRMRFRYQTSGIGPDAGLRWRVIDVARNAELAEEPVQLSSEAPKEEVIRFAAAAKTRLARLVLAYQRVLGTTRPEGWVSLSNIRLDFVP